ncbi:MAG: HIT family protein [Firmicutes bacterium]|nr:HIT family protein [Bacillota bacterium]
MDCLFCKIIEGEIPSYTIYEDEIAKVFLDINPNTNGHCLIIPKKHIVTVDEVDEELASHIVTVEKQIHKLLKEKLNIAGLTICQNNNLGQEVKHYHVHLIPRYKDDNWEINFNQKSLNKTEDIYQKITN